MSLKQTSICSYFYTGSGGSTKAAKVVKARPKRSRRKLNFEMSCSHSDDDLNVLEPRVICTVEKRRLCVQICSEDEDDATNNGDGDSKNGIEVHFNLDSQSSCISGSIATSVASSSVNGDDSSPDDITRHPEKHKDCDKNASTSYNKDVDPEGIAASNKNVNTPKKTTVIQEILFPSPSKPRKIDVDPDGIAASNKNVDTPRKITVIQDILFPSPSKSPRTTDGARASTSKDKSQSLAKEEHKKPNLHNLIVMKNFHSNVGQLNHLKCLMSKEEEETLDAFFEMDDRYQYTCIKLFTYKPTWYNIFKYVNKINLMMPDDEVMEMYEHLRSKEFVHTDYMSESVTALLNFLEAKDLRDIHKKFRLGTIPNKKENIINKLLENCSKQSTLMPMKSMEQVLKDHIKKKMGFCVKMSKSLFDCLYRIYLLNTFANPRYSKPTDYFSSVGYLNVVFPKYQVEEFLIFYTEDEFSRYVDAIKRRNEAEKALEDKNASGLLEVCKSAFRALKHLVDEGQTERSRPPHLERFSAAYQYVSLLSSSFKHLQSSYYSNVKTWLEYLLALPYCSHKRGLWYTQLALIETKYLKQYEQAAKTVISALKKEADCFSDVQLHELANRGRLLNKITYNVSRLYLDKIVELSPRSCDRDWPSITTTRRTMPGNKSGRKRKYFEEDEYGDRTFSSVEQMALNHYLLDGYSGGRHYENSLICCLFCLLFWDVIYDTYVKGTFVSRVQSAPLDMYTKYFYINRKDAIERRLGEIREGWQDEELKKVLVDTWNGHSHEAALCKIDAVVEDPEELFDIVMCVGRGVLSRILERLAISYGTCCSGFPDLLVWDVEGKKCKFVEVKGEKDKLSIRQKLWLNYLQDSGADIEVCHVLPPRSKKKPKTTARGDS